MLRGTQDRQEEEAWLDSNANNTRNQESVGSQVDLLIGLIMGFYGGVIVSFFLFERGLFSRRHKVGIMGGLLVNLSFGFLRWFYS
jgi:hypothetical protein